MLEIKHVHKGYDGKEVLKDISFQVRKGEIHGLIGENSAGKTTLMKCLVGIYKPERGEILYDGQPVFDQPEVKENIGYVADYNSYLRGYTIGRLLKLYETMYPGFSLEKFRSLNERFHLEAKSLVQSLSKGQKTKLAFLLAIASGASYLILDEPTSGMDVQSRKDMLDVLVSQVEERNLAVLVSSHNLEGLEKICDRTTLIREGRVVTTTDVEDFKHVFIKVQVVFQEGAPQAFYDRKDFLERSNVGSIYTVVAQSDFASLEKEFLQMGASLVEQLPLSLEDSFLLMNKRSFPGQIKKKQREDQEENQ